MCQGYAQCAFLAPDVFRFVGNEELMYVPEPDDSMRVNVLRAARRAPLARSWSTSTISPPRGEECSRRPSRRCPSRIVGESLAGLRRQRRCATSVTTAPSPSSVTRSSPRTTARRCRAGPTRLCTGAEDRAATAAQPRRRRVVAGRAATVSIAGSGRSCCDGRRVDYDRVVIATGVAAVRGRSPRKGHWMASSPSHER